MKKIVFIVLLVIAAAASVFITITIDPAVAKAEGNILEYHKESSVIFINGYYTDIFMPKIQDQAYKTKLQKDIDAITKVINTDIDPEKDSNYVSDISSAKIEDLEKKAVAAGKGIAKIIAIADKIEKEMPESEKANYDKSKLQKLKSVYALIASGASKGGTTKVLIIALIAIIAGIAFIFIEKSARKSGEIKASEVA